TLQPATATEGLDYNFQREEDEQIDADAVFKKLSSLKSTQKDEDEDDQY
ncbi:cytoplasmic protein, partial [Bacillus cereus]